MKNKYANIGKLFNKKFFSGNNLYQIPSQNSQILNISSVFFDVIPALGLTRFLWIKKYSGQFWGAIHPRPKKSNPR